MEATVYTVCYTDEKKLVTHKLVSHKFQRGHYLASRGGQRINVYIRKRTGLWKLAPKIKGLHCTVMLTEQEIFTV